ncbi:hypothetical protein Vretimale_14501 [Volvox reticuliferus]|uniref:Uncharacterized protein n=1 Tax=Volvox reticuliferus TaxID=1737510 RepID=A0A8J4FUE5_9CHLO|nr:hypothetical protein Vretifemale_13333 [Volvox reticuliferus]GIM10896.1 hypothetical protein Vretimale_14501 [Volvox reticuliferus]
MSFSTHIRSAPLAGGLSAAVLQMWPTYAAPAPAVVAVAAAASAFHPDLDPDLGSDAPLLLGEHQKHPPHSNPECSGVAAGGVAGAAGGGQLNEARAEVKPGKESLVVGGAVTTAAAPRRVMVTMLIALPNQSPNRHR